MEWEGGGDFQTPGGAVCSPFQEVQAIAAHRAHMSPARFASPRAMSRYQLYLSVPVTVRAPPK
jgi:hypothetical protein